MTGGIATSPNLSRSAERAWHHIDAWVRQPAFPALLGMFGGSSQPVDERSVLGIMGQASRWSAGEDVSAVRALPGRHGRIVAQLVALEEFADFAWNFRQGVPRAVLHLLKSAHEGGAALAPMLPTLADRSRWFDQTSAAELLEIYLGNGDDAPVAEALREQAISYPDLAGSGYRERWQAADLPFGDGARRMVHAAADVLGLVTPGLPTGHYDHVVVLGGGGTSPWIRAHYAAELIEQHDLRPAHIWMLGSPRPVADGAERTLIERFVNSSAGAVSSRYLSATSDEFDLMAVAAEAAFGVDAFGQENVCGCSSLSSPCPAWIERIGAGPTTVEATNPHFQHQRQRTYVTGAGPRVHVLSASTSRPPDRPNTADTYELLSRQAHLRAGARLLIVTTQVFVPFQKFDALRMLQLPHGVDVDVVGFGADRGDRPSTPEFELQEILSGLRSARRLAAVLTNI